MPSYQAFREKYPEFLYHGYQIEEDREKIRIQYHFEITGLSAFTPYWVFPKKVGSDRQFKGDRTFEQLVFSLGLVELVSYWKITCSPRVRVLCGTLNEAQIRWWKSLYFNGLGEFYYTNGISDTEEAFMRIEAAPRFDAKTGAAAQTPSGTETGDSDLAPRPSEAARGCLIPVGGGKDSAVTLDLLRASRADNKCFIINPRGATLNTVDAAGYDRDTQLVAVKRTLDARMLELNRQGFLNGHTPFSAIVAFSSTIAAYMYGLKYIVLSNESSANESTVSGSYVNHQYSKSFKFEKDFHEYEAEYIQSGTFYFSLLRPLSEFQIAAYFAKCPQYHDIFRSCNAGSKQDIWCGQCSKCLFVFLILSPFIAHERLTEIFGTDMLEDPRMLTYFAQLIGLTEEKPFECVGSRDEINTAICMTVDHMNRDGEPLPYLLKYYMTTGLYEKYHRDKCPYDDYYDEENLLPEPFEKIVRAGCLRNRDI